MKRIIRRPVTTAFLVLVIATTLILMISYAYGMGCPSDNADTFSLRIESVMVDGVQQEDLSAYYQHSLVATTLGADISRSQAGDGDTVTADHVYLRFHARVGGPGSYDEIFSLDSDNR